LRALHHWSPASAYHTDGDISVDKRSTRLADALNPIQVNAGGSGVD
jgi:hypothetical protein